jgi:hypothetical protein
MEPLSSAQITQSINSHQRYRHCAHAGIIFALGVLIADARWQNLNTAMRVLAIGGGLVSAGASYKFQQVIKGLIPLRALNEAVEALSEGVAKQDFDAQMKGTWSKFVESLKQNKEEFRLSANFIAQLRLFALYLPKMNEWQQLSEKSLISLLDKSVSKKSNICGEIAKAYIQEFSAWVEAASAVLEKHQKADELSPIIAQARLNLFRAFCLYGAPSDPSQWEQRRAIVSDRIQDLKEFEQKKTKYAELLNSHVQHLYARIKEMPEKLPDNPSQEEINLAYLEMNNLHEWSRTLNSISLNPALEQCKQLLVWKMIDAHYQQLHTQLTPQLSVDELPAVMPFITMDAPKDSLLDTGLNTSVYFCKWSFKNGEFSEEKTSMSLQEALQFTPPSQPQKK